MGLKTTKKNLIYSSLPSEVRLTTPAPHRARSSLVVVGGQRDRGGVANVCLIGLVIMLLQRLIVVGLQLLEQLDVSRFVHTGLLELAADHARALHGREHLLVHINDV